MAESLKLEVQDSHLQEATDVAQVLKIWEEKCDEMDFDPTQYLTRLAEIIEDEIDQYSKLDPDPFDDRHPFRTHPQCSYGQSLKTVFKKEVFMDRLVSHYLKERWGSNDLAVNTAACRLFIGILPGMESSAVYQETEDLVRRLFRWAETSPDPLRSYALGLLGASMEVPEVASKFKDHNVHLVPLTLCRVRGLQAEMITDIERPFAQFAKNTPTTQKVTHTPVALSNGVSSGSGEELVENTSKAVNSHIACSNGPLGGNAIPASLTPGSFSPVSLNGKRKRALNNTLTETPLSGRKKSRLDQEYEELQVGSRNPSNRENLQDIFGASFDSDINALNDKAVKEPPSLNECSSSSWVEMESNIIGTMKIYPLTPASKQVLSLRYLTPLGEYQEMLSYAFKNNAVELIMNYLDTYKTKDSRLTFEALKYLSALLCHKKFAVEFIRKGGLLKMLKIPRPSISATGVSLCLYYIAYAEDAMEKVCLMPKSVLTNLVAYAMWLLECSHASGRNHALMFFGASYPFKIMLDLFDAQDGLRVILNIISTLPNFLAEETDSEEGQMLTRQVVRQVSYNLKRYFECHMSFLAEKIEKMQQQIAQVPRTEGASYYKPLKHDPAKLRELNTFLLPLMPLWARWHPVEKLIKLGGHQYLMQVIAFAYDWNYSGRAETVRSVLDILAICCLVPRVQFILTERITLQGTNNLTYGLSIILSAAEGEVVADPDVQRSALTVIGNCVCGPTTRNGVALEQFQHPNAVSKTPIRKSNVRTCEDLLNKIWECVRVNNGILILNRLLLVKTPIRDADSIRSLACWCLAGLARYVPIRQVLEQLPLMKSGLIQILMREPILQENRQEHALFQAYALELIKLVYGKVTGVEYDLNVVAIQKSDLISQSRIHYNEKQLLELVRDHLATKGLSESAAALAKEAKLEPLPVPTPSTSKPNHIVNGLPLTPARKGKTSFGFQEPNTGKIKERGVTLDTIVTEYLTNQHSLCKTPMAICPTFDLVVPHKCPTPKARTPAINFAARFGRPGYDWSTAGNINRKLIYSRFKPIRVLRSPEEDHFTTAAFSSCNQWAIVGTHNGEVKLINILSGNEDGTYSCHDSEIHHVQPNLKGNLLITSSIWRRPLSKLWRMDTLFDIIMEFEREEYVEFSKLNQDKVIATNMEHAYIYDIETRKKILTLEPRISNQYTKNRATFDPNDELILCDGVLWDFKSGTEVHKFDKLNESISGVFHPKGLEIIANSEVWDVRTFKLLRTVRALDQCTLVFTNDGEIIYGTKCEKETSDGYKTADTSFVTLDATHYERIGTIELKRNIYSLATSPNDLQITLVENSSSEDSVNDSCVRFYEVGRCRAEEEQADEEDDEDEIQSQDSDDDDDDDESTDGLDVDRLLDELLPNEAEEFEIEDDSQEETEEEDVELVLGSDSEELNDGTGEAGVSSSNSGQSDSSSVSESDNDF